MKPMNWGHRQIQVVTRGFADVTVGRVMGDRVMTECEWLISIDPAAMLRHVERTATEQQLLAFVEACRERWVRSIIGSPIVPLDRSREWTAAFAVPSVESSVQAAWLRCIFGNPWRPVQKDRVMTEQEWLSSIDPAAMLNYARNRFSTEIHERFLVEADPRPCSNQRQRQADIIRDVFGNPWRPPQERGRLIRPAFQEILSWQDGTIPKLARAIRGERCDGCDGTGKVDMWCDHKAYTRCEVCHGTGKTPPQFDQMGQLADALLDAGAPEDLELVKHCQGWVRCSTCLGKGTFDPDTHGECECRYPADALPGWISCGGSGWVRSDAGHTAGCWVLSLLIGGE